MSELRERVYNTFKKRRDKIINGSINSIPTPFVRFSKDFLGITKACYYLITSYTKGGKSQFVSYLLYTAILYTYYHNTGISLKILYFNLEETEDKVLTRFISWLLYKTSGGTCIISPSDLMSTRNEAPLSDDVINRLNNPEFVKIVDFFSDHIEFSSESNPTGIYKFCKKYAEDHGKVYTKPCKYKDSMGITKDGFEFDHYEATNPDEWVIPVIDTINIMDTERGFNKKQSIDKMSEYLAKYCRNRYSMSPIVIQQQNTDNESVESMKFNKTRPSTAGLGDSKYTGHDANIVLGIFSPFKFGIENYLGYNVVKFKDHLRFLEVLINRDKHTYLYFKIILIKLLQF